ncbi:MAG TPA: 4-hydroxybenzoate 3-monooxygenase [Polyangiaceae bacterium]|nr:4-hydroxybenzoate 3-monooxygenase [Polyangiaceae bacterium]
MRTQVGILGAGPAGLMLSHLLHLGGVESVVLEKHSREYIERRVRAGVLEQGTVDLLTETGLGERLQREGMVHHGIHLRFGGRTHRIGFGPLTAGRKITVYGQQEVVKDLVQARLAAGGALEFSVEDVTLRDLDAERPRVRFVAAGSARELECDFVAGCDGSHGVSRRAIPEGSLATFERTYPYAWLGILAQAPPAQDELVYAHHERGFALFSMRSPKLTRLYLQVDPEERLENWSDDRIWSELRTRLATSDGWHPNEGPIVERGVTGMRSSVIEPMQFGRLYLAGDAAHIVPPTGAKGMNLAIADVRVLAAALIAYFKTGDTSALARYSETCLRRVWRAEHFSWWMTSMLHRAPHDDAFESRLQRSELEYVVRSRAAATSLAENYVGLSLDWDGSAELERFGKHF